jgi:ankyrin repeat protein
MKIIMLKNLVVKNGKRMRCSILFKMLPQLFILQLLVVPAAAQSQPETVMTDTSYFRPGEDDWNLVESVINISAANTALLLERGANPNAVSSTGNSALMYAVEKGNMEIMKMLVEQGADVNATGFNKETPLFIAIFKNDFQSAKYLLEQGADPNVKDAFGITPLIYAAATNQYQSADLLMFYNADESVTDDQGNDPLMAAVTFENVETSDVLLQNGLSPDTRDNEGNTPAIVATQRGRYDILELLLDYNADVNIPNNKNYTPLAYAITYGDTLAAGMLIEQGADVHHRVDRGRNMAELARISGNRPMIEMISSNGGTPSKGSDFSEFQFTFGNSFNGTDYLMQFRGGIVDTKGGYYFETGVDFRPFQLRVQTYLNDTLFQFREKRGGWSHTAGKYFRLTESTAGTGLSAYAALTGYMSFPNYQGTSNDPPVGYHLIPSAGIALKGHYVGVRAGADWYRFGNILEKGLKWNVSVIFRLKYPKMQYDRKEITWE